MQSRVGLHEVCKHLVARNPASAMFDWSKFGNRLAVDGDDDDLPTLGARDERARVVAKFTRRNHCHAA